MLIVKKKYGSFETFEGGANANKCLPYDEVSYTHSGCTLVKRTNHPTLVGVLQTTGTRYGFTKTHNSIYLCNPLDERYPPFCVGSKIVDRLRNKLITFSFDHWTDALPRGIFLSLLGDCGIAEAEKKACLLKASPWGWKALPEIVEPSWEREHIFGAFTIDPVGCKDADDCISFLENGIAISIADVSAYVEVNPWMKFAEHIGTSLYENGTCVKPMFPPLLSEDKFSLVEGQDRLAYSLFITFTPEGIKHEWKETIVNVKAYNYESIYETDTTLLKEYVFRLSGLSTDDSHKWIEVFMLYYNTQAAEKAAILRKQKGRNMERARLFEPLSDTYMYLSYESAKYSLPSDGITSTFHSQLGVEKYAHASSPIRRYVDIINQFALKGKLLEYSCLERFNAIQSAAKTFERELLFLNLYYGSKHTLEGIVLDGEHVFIPCLKKVIPHLNILPPKTTVSIKYYTNPQGGNWKEKILFQVE